MSRIVPPRQYIQGISIPDIQVETTMGSDKRAIFVNGKEIIGYMIKNHSNNIHKNKVMNPDWIAMSVDEQIIVNANIKSQAMLLLWMALEIRKARQS